MSEVAELTVNIAGKDVGLSRILQQLETRMNTTDATGRQLSDVFGRALPAGQQKSADAALRHAQALARTAQAMGDTAGATRILVSGLNQAAGASDQAVASASAQLSRLQSTKTLATEFGAAFKSGLLGIVGPAAAAGAAISAVTSVVQSFGEALQLKAQLDATTAAVNVQLRGVRDTGEVWQQAAIFARQYGLTQQEVNAGVSASIGILRSSSASLEDVLGVLARMQILSPEQSISDAALALKALASGDTQSLVARFEVSRDLAAQMKQEIAAGGDAVKVMSDFLNQMGVSMDAVAAKTQGVNGKFLELKQAQEDLQLAQAAWAEGPGLVVLQGQITTLSGLTRVLTGDTEAMGQSWRNNMDAYAQWLGLTDQAIASGGQWSQVLTRNTSEVGALTLSMDAERTAIANATIAGQEHAAQLEEDALKAQIASVQAEALALKKNQLAQQAQIAAQALLASGAAGEQTANRLAGSSSLVDVLTAAYYRLAAAQQAAAVAAVKTAALKSGVSDSGAIQELKQEQLRERTAQRSAKAAKDYADMLDAQKDRIRAIGTEQERLAQAQQELADARKRFGAGSDEAFRAETALLQAQQKAAKGGAAAHKAAGATRISDQQKLHNSLLADEEKFADQAAAAAEEHQQRILDIEAEFQQKSLEQQQRNEVSKRQSRADFYDSLTEATKDVGPQIAGELSAAYEQAYAQAQQIAQAGNQKLAADYLALKEQQIRDELEFQRKIAAAKEEGDRAEVARLEAIHKLRQDAAAEEERQLLAGGDANVKDRADALDEEGRKFEEQQAKIGDSAESAAARKITAAERAGKAIDAENLKLVQQEQLYQRIAAAGGGGAPAAGQPGAPGALPAAPGVPTVPGIAAAGPDLASLAAQLQAVVDALHTEGGRIVQAQQDTTSAVKQAGANRGVGK